MSSLLHEFPPRSPSLRLRPHLGPRRLELRCAGCGYGCVVSHLPGRCPMCGASRWAAVRAAGAGTALR